MSSSIAVIRTDLVVSRQPASLSSVTRPIEVPITGGQKRSRAECDGEKNQELDVCVGESSSNKRFKVSSSETESETVQFENILQVLSSNKEEFEDEEDEDEDAEGSEVSVDDEEEDEEEETETQENHKRQSRKTTESPIPWDDWSEYGPNYENLYDMDNVDDSNVSHPRRVASPPAEDALERLGYYGSEADAFDDEMARRRVDRYIARHF
ncbi:hypothetical protein C8Q75DRAFT_789739 [Abortiporus biennis]|nr:hypothetical protein C8Q75DRAFT_789739 [Abortiporus biennis]